MSPELTMTHLKFKLYPLPHYNNRPEGTPVDTIIVHSMFAQMRHDQLSPDACISTLDSSEVSAHYAIAQDGELWKMVAEADRAWHAGVSRLPFDDRSNVNDFSIGIELINRDDAPFPEAQYRALAALCAEIMTRHKVRFIVGHDHIAPGRKTDPGLLFDWDHFKKILLEISQLPELPKLPQDIRSIPAKPHSIGSDPANE